MPPEFVSVSCSDFVLLASTEPKLKLDGLAVKAPALTPVPLTDHVIGDPGALEATLTVPEAPVAAVGAKVTLKLVLWPAARVIGVVMPLRVNPDPEIVALLMLTLEPPEFVIVAFCFWFCPTCTDPNAITLDPVVNEPGVTPVPDRAMLKEEFVALLTIATLPVELAAVWGAKLTEKLALCPAGMVAGVVKPLMLKPVPVTEA